MEPTAIIVMGVSGSGKSTIGRKLATVLNHPFFDADDYHPPANIAKMATGTPLNDDDRAPWLAILRDLINVHTRANRPVIIACSALKKAYRDMLKDGNDGVQIVYLHGSYETILARMQARGNHFMRPAMLQSQFATLEEPAHAIRVDIDLPPYQIVAQLAAKFGGSAPSPTALKKINHIGIAVPDIDAATGVWADVLGLSVSKRETVNEQGVNVAFLPVGESKIELIEPLEPNNAIGRYLQKRGPGMHHICFEVDDIDQTLADLKAADVRLIDEVARAASGGKRLAFIHPKSTGGVLVELYELPSSH